MQKRRLIGRVIPPPPEPMTKKRELCGANNKQNKKKCTNYAMANGRCRLHGGKSLPQTPEAREAMKGNKRTFKHGIYGEGLLDEEKEMFDELMAQVGSLDNEIMVAQVMLMRASKAQARWEQLRGIMTRQPTTEEAYQYGVDNGVLEPVEFEHKEEQVPVGSFEYGITLEDKVTKSLKRRKHDFSKEIHKYAKLIGTLKEKRKVLLGAGTGDVDFVRRLAEDLRDFNDNAGPTLPGGAMFGQEDTNG